MCLKLGIINNYECQIPSTIIIDSTIFYTTSSPSLRANFYKFLSFFWNFPSSLFLHLELKYLATMSLSIINSETSGKFMDSYPLPKLKSMKWKRINLQIEISCSVFFLADLQHSWLHFFDVSVIFFFFFSKKNKD